MTKHFLRMPYMALAVLVLFFTSCETDNPISLPDTLSFNIEKSTTLDLQAAPALGRITLSDVKMQIDLDSALAANGANNFTVSNVQAKSVVLETITPETNLDAFDTLSIFVTSKTLPEAKVAYKEGIANNITSLPMDVNTVNVAEYLKEKPANFKIQAYIGDSIKKPMTMKVNMVFKVDVKKK